MTGQSSRSTAYDAHGSRTYSFELDGTMIDPNLSQSHEKVKEKDHHVCLKSNGILIKPCNNRSLFNFVLFGEKLDPNLDLSDVKEKKDYLDRRFRNTMNILHACNNDPDFMMHGGYLLDRLPIGSDHYIHKDRNKGSTWSEDEHRAFLKGLGELGKGNWREISKKYVRTRTPTQVASHAQKYFINKKKAKENVKRRSSLFDMSNESMGYGNNSNVHKYDNPGCSTMAPFGSVMSGFYPICNSSNNWTQQTSQAHFVYHPLATIDESSRASFNE